MSVLLSRPPPMREDDSDLLAETLQDGLNGHHGRHHPLAEDDLEDIITCVSAPTPLPHGRRLPRPPTLLTSALVVDEVALN